MRRRKKRTRTRRKRRLRAQGPGRLTTGLARAELALEEARELQLRWPLYSEGCCGYHRTCRQKQSHGVRK